MPFRTKVLLLYAGFLTLIIVAFSVAITGAIKPTIIASIDKSLETVSAAVLSNIHTVPESASNRNDASVYVVGEDFLRMPGISVQVWQTHNGDEKIEPLLIASSLDLAESRSALDPLCVNLTRITFSDVSAPTSYNDMPLRVMTRPIVVSGGQQFGVVQVASSTMIVDDVTRDILDIVIVVAAVGVLIAIVLGMVITNRALRPMQQMTAAATRISTSNDLTTRLQTDLPNDEIGRLARAFNHMMVRLEQLFAVQQRFVADLSHELRTPLTAILGNLDLIKLYGQDDAALEAIEIETKRMTRMVNEVLLLARVDSGDAFVEMRPLDLDVLVLEAFNKVFELGDAKNRKLNIKLDTQERLCVRGDQERLQLMLENLITNAIRFTPDGGTVDVSLYSRAGRFAVIEVQDSGIGIDKQDIQRIFDRFYQVDGSRRHSSDADGAGLGLSIVKWVADEHRAAIEVESEPEKGSVFRVVMPFLD